MARVIKSEIADAHDDAARIRAAARDEIAREREALQRTLTLAARAELAAEHLALERARSALREETEDAIVPLAVAVARRVIGEEIEARPEHVRAIAREALSKMGSATRVRLRVHPLDAGAVRELGAEVITDGSVTRGGCVVESELGEVDARIEVRIDSLADALARAT